jgi:DNA recombination protein Rad52
MGPGDGGGRVSNQTQLTDDQRAMLEAPLDPRRVSQRQGSGGKSLNFLQSHDVKRTANRIFGYDGWSYTVDELVCLGEEPYKSSKGKEGTRVGYRATVTVRIGETLRGDTGYGDAIEYQHSRITPHELASKEAVSDATKRCLASWGDQFGLVLYGEDPIRESAAEIPEYATDEEVQYIKDLADQAGYAEARTAELIIAEIAEFGGVRKKWADVQISALRQTVGSEPV